MVDDPFTFPYWLGSNLNWDAKSWAIIFSRTLPGAGVSDIGLRSFNDLGDATLGIGTIFALFHWSGNTPCLRHALIILHIGVAISGQNSERILGGISPGPGDLFDTLFRSL